MCTSPVLTQPDFDKRFFLQTDASAYGMGAVLLQEGELTPSLLKHKKPTLHPISYYSATFTPMECNYDIYERELLAIMKSLAHWRPYLGWTKHPFLILTNHANLQYWKSPKTSTGELLGGMLCHVPTHSRSVCKTIGVFKVATYFIIIFYLQRFSYVTGILKK
jgi:hypothetical protein